MACVHLARANPALRVGDFGCGDAKIARSVPNTVHSFDLVAVNDRVTACDMAHVRAASLPAQQCCRHWCRPHSHPRNAGPAP
ncbi:MAG: hypothetical protein ACK4NM_18785 [Hydrogenophaga sp.]